MILHFYFHLLAICMVIHYSDEASKSSTATLWEQAKVPYRVDASLASDTALKALFDSAITHIQTGTCITFVDDSSTAVASLSLGHTRVLLVKGGAGSCTSQIGRTGDSSTQDLNLDNSCVNGAIRTIVHELCHTLGLRHEFKRPDRDKYINYTSANVESSKISQFAIDNNLDLSERYDISSTMQYGGSTFSSSGQTMTAAAILYAIDPTRSSTGNGHDNLGGDSRAVNDALSFRDKATLNKIYNCAGSCSGAACENGGYKKADCSCECPPLFTGSNCETLDTSSNDAACGTAEITAASGDLTPPGYENDAFTFNLECVWIIKGAANQLVQIKMVEMEVDRDPDSSDTKADGDCKSNDDANQKDKLKVYLYGTDVDVDIVSCKPQDKTNYLGQWSSSDTNQVIVHWQSIGVFERFPSPDALVANNKGWKLSYQLIDNSASASVDSSSLASNVEATSSSALVDASVTESIVASSVDSSISSADNTAIDVGSTYSGGINPSTTCSGTENLQPSTSLTASEHNAATEEVTAISGTNNNVNTGVSNVATTAVVGDSNIQSPGVDSDPQSTAISPQVSSESPQSTDTVTNEENNDPSTTTQENKAIDIVVVVVTMTVTNQEYKEEYEDINSEESRIFTSTFISMLVEVFPYESSWCKVTGLRSGSVIVDYEVTFPPSVAVTQESFTEDLVKKLEDNGGTLGSFTADKESISVAVIVTQSDGDDDNMWIYAVCGSVGGIVLLFAVIIPLIYMSFTKSQSNLNQVHLTTNTGTITGQQHTKHRQLSSRYNSSTYRYPSYKPMFDNTLPPKTRYQYPVYERRQFV